MVDELEHGHEVGVVDGLVVGHELTLVHDASLSAVLLAACKATDVVALGFGLVLFFDGGYLNGTGCDGCCSGYGGHDGAHDGNVHH